MAPIRRLFINLPRNVLHNSRFSLGIDSSKVPTHTGQVNKQFAIKLIDDVPPIACFSRTVSCDGGDGALGHPKVYINLDQEGPHICGYCGLRYYFEHKG